MSKVKKRILIVLSVIPAIVVFVLLAFFGLYFTRIQTISSMEQLTDYPDGYNLYRMDVKYDYSLEDIIDYGIKDDQTMIDAILKEALPGTKFRLHGTYSDRYGRQSSYGT